MKQGVTPEEYIKLMNDEIKKMNHYKTGMEIIFSDNKSGYTWEPQWNGSGIEALAGQAYKILSEKYFIRTQ